MVVAIIGIIAAIAAPRYAASLTRYRADSAARRVVADLALAQRVAAATSSSRDVEFDTLTHSYLIEDVRALDGTATDYETFLLEPPYEARITFVDFGGETDVTFDGYGMPDSGGTVIVQRGDVQMTIVLDPDTGLASVQ